MLEHFLPSLNTKPEAIKVQFCSIKELLFSTKLISHHNISTLNVFSIFCVKMSSHHRQTEWRVSIMITDSPGDNQSEGRDCY